MGVFPQDKTDPRGSLRWIQRAVIEKPGLLDSMILPHLGNAQAITWLSPLKNKRYAEYRDADFLDQIGHLELIAALKDFWPAHGPQWDALAHTDDGQVLLVEAKAHIPELCSPGTQASSESRAVIERALDEAAHAAHASPHAPWADLFYQLGNRLAHLHFLRSQGVPAWLILVNFIGDSKMEGPETSREWDAAYQVVYHVMGIPPRSPILKHVIHICPEIGSLK